MTEKYRPGSGTEGDCFFAAWCYKCARHPEEEDDDVERCEIIYQTFLYPATDEQYPKEWIVGKNGPECTAFVPRGEPVPAPRCEHTADMFQQPAEVQS